MSWASAEGFFPEEEGVFFDEGPEVIMIRADEVPELHFPRVQHRRDAHEIIDDRYQLLSQGKLDQIPLELNALGTANRVLRARDVFGEDSSEHKAAMELLHEDTSRLVGEAYRRRSYGYFRPVTHLYDAAEDTFLAQGYSLKEMTRNALTVVSHDEEGQRRINEYVEEATAADFMKLESHQGRPIDEWRMLTISECPDWAIKLYANDQQAGIKRGYGGYVPEIRKLAIRVHAFDSALEERHEEQVLLPGLEITHDVILQALRAAELLDEAEEPDKTELHGMHFFVHQSVISSALDATSLLDAAASEATGQTILMGERAHSASDLHYARIPLEALEFEGEQAQLVQELVEYILKLKELGIEDKHAPKRIAGFLDNQLHESAQQNPALAEVIFDQNTADNYREYNRLIAAADNFREDDPQRASILEQAQQQLLKTMDEAPKPDFCGADCSIEELEFAEKLEAMLMGLKGINQDSVDQKKFFRKKDARCTECGRSRTVIALGKKGCLDCKEVADIGILADFARSFKKKWATNQDTTQAKSEPPSPNPNVPEAAPTAESTPQQQGSLPVQQAQAA